jgi:uncharacterized membrane protein
MRIGLEIRNGWDRLLSSLWFRPAVLTGGIALSAFATVQVDRVVGDNWRLFQASVDDARAILSSITSSLLTVTTVTFSILMVALVLASQQYSPRVIRNLMRDARPQYVLGLFIGTFLYSLLVLAQTSSITDRVFVPLFSIVFSVVLTLISIVAFIFFIHHVAESIQATSIIGQAAASTAELLEQRFPASIGESGDDAALEDTRPVGQPTAVPSAQAGYIQSVDATLLLDLAERDDLVVEMARAIGDFVPAGNPLLYVWAERPLTPGQAAALQDTYEIGAERTFFDDVLYGFRQLADIALRAISPAVNDPTTACMSIDHMTNILVQAARQPDPAPYRYDRAGRLRIIARGVDFAQMLAGAFSQIRQYAARDVAVTLRLLEGLTEIALATAEPERQTIIWQHAAMIARGAERGIPEPGDRELVNERLRRLSGLLDRPAAPLLLTLEAGPAANQA